MPPMRARIPTGPGFENIAALIWMFIHIPSAANTTAPTTKPSKVSRITGRCAESEGRAGPL